MNVRRKFMILATSAAAAIAVAAALFFASSRGGASVAPYSFAPAHFAAVEAPATRVGTLPPVVAHLSRSWGMEVPAANAVHTLGHGAAVAWVDAGRVCWASSNVAGCTDPARQAPIGIVLGETEQGQPYVEGLAVDGVRTVTITLRDGRTASASPAANFYHVVLPSDARPWNVASVAATYPGAPTYRQSISLTAPDAVPTK
jgi:ABC-type phosphate/phosphonate transport system substrate-binding protein